MFDNLTSKFSGAFSSLRTKGRLKSGDIDEIGAEIRAALIESDVALDVVDSFIERITQRSKAKLDEVNKGINPSQAIFTIVNEELTAILGGNSRRISPAVLKTLGDDVVIASNTAGILGGVRAWEFEGRDH